MNDFEKKIPIGEIGIDEEFTGKFPTDAFEFTEASVADPTITVKKGWKLLGDGGVSPIGSIIMFGAATAPTGWVLCDNSSLLRTGIYANLFDVIGTTFGSVDGTHFNTPDMRGIFPRGAGTHGSLTNANSAAFSGTLGTEQNDSFQGHRHTQNIGGTGILTAGDVDLQTPTGGSSAQYQVLSILDPTTDGSSGTPRTGNETNPANLGLTFIIKY